MNKTRGSVLTKLILWGVFLASMIGTAIFGCLIVIASSEGFFYMTSEEAIKYYYAYANASYSMDAFRNRADSQYGRMLAQDGFRFGIIESSSLKDIDFQDRASYIGTNMTDEELSTLDKDGLFLYQITEYDDQSCTASMMGYYGDYEDISSIDVVGGQEIREESVYADSICYDVSSGILYYRADGMYYPVQNVSISAYDSVVYDYSFDFERGAYRLVQAAPAFGESDDPESASGEIETELSVQEREQIETILRGTDGITDFSRLNMTAFGYTDWGTIVLDGIRELDGSELIPIDSEDIGEEHFRKIPGYYLNENFTLIVEKELKGTDHWVVSQMPDLSAALPSGSRYNDGRWAVDLYYGIGRDALPLFGGCLLLAFVSFILLACAAGYRKGREGIFLTWSDKIPLEILTVAVCGAELLMLFTFFNILEVFDVTGSYELFLAVISMMSAALSALGMWYLLSLCVRVKNGKWWRCTVCYWAFSRMRAGVSGLLRNMDMLWKLILAMCILSLLEFCVIAGTDRTFTLFCWAVEKLVLYGAVLFLAVQMRELQKMTRRLADGDLGQKIDTSRMFWECRKHGDNLNKIGEGISKAVDARMKSERFKTELITNVSHDIKTPLTSIINYVDLLGKEEFDNEKAVEYLEVLDRQSSKLKKLIEDLVEASKASSGNLAVDLECLELGVFITQTVGEFEEKLSCNGSELIVSKPEEPVHIMADGRHLWRVTDNLMNNICKYAQHGTRVYVDLEASEKLVHITFRNVSCYPLNMSGAELMERFVRGDRSRNTEGHGLGLSIAQSLVKIMGGDMTIVVDGDLFKVVVAFDRHEPVVQESREGAQAVEADPESD